MSYDHLSIMVASSWTVIGMAIRNYVMAQRAYQPEPAADKQPEKEPDEWPAVSVEHDYGTVPYMVDRLATFYDSEYAMVNQPWIRETSFEAWRDRQLAAKGMSL